LSPNNPETNFLSLTASLIASLAAMYSASTILCAMDPYFQIDQEIIADPKLKQYLEVLFRSIGLLAQSTSAYPCKNKPPLDVYIKP
jgi:hypothetical protein